MGVQVTETELNEAQAALVKSMKLRDLMKTILLARVEDTTHTAKDATIRALQSRGLLDRAGYATTLGCQVADALIWQRHLAQEAAERAYREECEAYEIQAQVLANEHYAIATNDDPSIGNEHAPTFLTTKAAMLAGIQVAYGMNESDAKEIRDIMISGDWAVRWAVQCWDTERQAVEAERWRTQKATWAAGAAASAAQTGLVAPTREEMSAMTLFYFRDGDAIPMVDQRVWDAIIAKKLMGTDGFTTLGMKIMDMAYSATLDAAKARVAALQSERDVQVAADVIAMDAEHRQATEDYYNEPVDLSATDGPEPMLRKHDGWRVGPYGM